MSKIVLFQPIYSSSGWWVAGAYPCSSGHKAGPNPGQDALPSKGYSHPYPHPLRLQTCQFSSSAHLWESLEKTHTDMGKRCKLHTDSGLAGNHFFSPRQCYNETMLEGTLSKVLLYSSRAIYAVPGIRRKHF